MNLILIKPSEIIEHHDSKSIRRQTILAKNDERANHILKHLRKQTGDQVSVGIIGGAIGKATLQLDDTSIVLILLDDSFEEPQVEPEITVIVALPFPARLKALWPVLASFGAVTRVVVVKGHLSNEEFCEASALQPKVYEALIEKGMSQGVRTRLVEVDVCIDECVSQQLLQQLGLSKENDCSSKNDVARLFLDCGNKNFVPPPARNVVLKYCSQCSHPKAIIAFGPERGWTDKEANLFVNGCGFESATLGSSILRVDTAVIVGVGIVSSALDECQEQGQQIHETSGKKRKG